MLGGIGLLIWWYDWGVFAGLIIAVAVTAWIFFDSQRRMVEALIWRIVPVVGLVMILPSLYSKFQTWDRILSGQITQADVTAALQIYSNLQLFAYLGVLGTIVAIIAAFGYLVVPQPPPDDYAYPPLDDTMREVPPPSPAPTRRERAPRVLTTEIVDEEPRAMAWLAVKSGARKGKQFRLEEGRNTIGRDGTRCDHILDDTKVSREHARVQYENGRFVIYDLASRNHTFVNGQRVQRQTLMDDDELTLGTTTLIFKEA